MKLFSFLFGVAFACLSPDSTGQASPRIHFEDGLVLISGIAEAPSAHQISNDAWKEILAVFTLEAFQKGIAQAIGGSYSLSNGQIVFRPAFPFAPGTSYRAVFSARALAKYSVDKTDEADISLTFEVPREEYATTYITALHPATDVLPENLLRMYITFSAPMMPGQAYEHFTLYDENGKKVDRAFLVVDQELWDADRKRLTILFDPGRIKRGLKANIDLGPPLREGKRYRLVIDSAWRDAHGNHLGSGFEKTILVSPPQRTKLSTNQIKVISPEANSIEPLVVLFDRPIDHGLVNKYVSIYDGFSNAVEGEFELINDNTLKFLPKRAWHPGSFNVSFSPLLEDVCGNNFNNAFDVDLAKEPRVHSTEEIKIAFSVKSPAK